MNTLFQLSFMTLLKREKNQRPAVKIIFQTCIPRTLRKESGGRLNSACLPLFDKIGDYDVIQEVARVAYTLWILFENAQNKNQLKNQK